jgi:hypothetical protein
MVWHRLTIACGNSSLSAEIDEIMRQADTDGDGKISFPEFVSMMNQRLFRRYEVLFLIDRSVGTSQTSANFYSVN